MLTIQTDNVTVEIKPESHFSIIRGEADEDRIRIEWSDLDESAVVNLNQFVEMIEGSLEGMMPEE